MGNFNEVFELLAPCIKYSSDTQQKLVALRLLALSNFALDSVEKADQYVLELLEINPNYETGLFDLSQFVEAIQRLKKQTTATFVTSVSKKAEDVKLTPGTVLVIHEKDIKERGYTDLEALMSDLPGFDISRTRGITYSNIYQRGYRGNNTDRTLFLIDGVEDNELWTNTTFLGTQFPLSNVKQIEIIYGPASTIYGPNAFSGVINVITKDPSISRANKPYSAHVEVGYGTYNTRYLDAYVAGKINNAALSITLRKYQSDYRDLSKFEDYNYSPADYDKVDYAKLLYVDSSAFRNFYNNIDSLHNFNDYYRLDHNSKRDTVAAIPTELAIERARNADKDIVKGRINGKRVAYSNLADNIFFAAKLQLSHFTFGGQYWKARQGATNYQTDNYLGGAANATVWVPAQYHVYGKYKNEMIKNKLYIENFMQYRVTSFDDETKVTALFNYSNMFRTKHDLVNEMSPYWLTLYFYQISKQFRNELKITYNLSSKVDIVSGIELRNSFIQGNYIREVHGGPAIEDVQDFPSVIGTGSPTTVPKGGNHYEIMEIGTFAQLTYKWNKWMNIVLGVRGDHNRIRDTLGYGTIFNPRIAVIAYPNNYVFKVIYASAFQNASNWAKFATFPTRQLASPNLPPEETRNIDVSAGYNFSENLFLDVTYYHSTYERSVEPISVPYGEGTTLQHQAVGERQIQGLQSNVTWKKNNYKAYFNYTYTSPYSKEVGADGKPTKKSVRIGDIASHQFNVGVNAFYFDHLNVNLRFNYVGKRETGPGTSVPHNLHTFDPVYLMNGSLTYQNLLPNMDVQFGCNNILDLEYNDPGIRAANGTNYAMATPQNRRNCFIKLICNL